MNVFRLFIVITFLIFSCKQKEEKTLFTIVEDSNITFKNTITGSKNLNVFNYRNFYNGGGVAIGDLNNDGLPEVFLPLTRDQIHCI